jgi:hypothetical protein
MIKYSDTIQLPHRISNPQPCDLYYSASTTALLWAPYWLPLFLQLLLLSLCMICPYKRTPWPLVRKRPIATDGPPLVGDF